MGTSQVQSTSVTSKKLSASRKFAAVVLTPVLAFATSGCGAGGGGSNERVVDFSNCDTKPDVGASALKSHATKTEWVVSDFFSKPYDRYDLEAVLDASSTSTTDYVQALGLTLLKVPRANATKQCPTYFNLAVAQGPYAQVWKQASGKNTGNGALAGVYFEFCGSGTGASCSPRRVVQPTILVDEVSDRWTLIHEMMHHNFNHARKADLKMPTTAELQIEMDRLIKTTEKAMADFKDLPNRQDLLKAAEAIRATIAIGHQLMVRKPLEEVAIESLLLDEWSKGRLRNVSISSAKSGIWYMKYSRDEFSKDFRPYAPMIAKIRKTAEENFWDDVIAIADETKTQLQGHTDDLNKIISDAEDKVAAAEEAARNADEELSGNSLFDFGFASRHDGAKGSITKPTDLVQDHERIKFQQHLESHDQDGLMKAFETTTKELETLLDSAL